LVLLLLLTDLTLHYICSHHDKIQNNVITAANLLLVIM